MREIFNVLLINSSVSKQFPRLLSKKLPPHVKSKKYILNRLLIENIMYKHLEKGSLQLISTFVVESYYHVKAPIVSNLKAELKIIFTSVSL